MNLKWNIRGDKNKCCGWDSSRSLCLLCPVYCMWLTPYVINDSLSFISTIIVFWWTGLKLRQIPERQERENYIEDMNLRKSQYWQYFTKKYHTFVDRVLLNTFQKRRVSSPAPVTIASPSGDIAFKIKE